MKIHTVQSGESLRSIAEEHGVPVSRIFFDNELDPPAKLCPGQAIIIGEPILTDRVRGGDTLERIAARNDTDVLTLLQNNPCLSAPGLIPSQLVNIEYRRENSQKIIVHAYSGTADAQMLCRRLPLVSILSVQNASLLQSGRVQLLDAAPKIAARARAFRALPILCVDANGAYGRHDADAVTQILSSPKRTERFIQSALAAVRNGGFSGLELDFAPRQSEDASRYISLLLALAGVCEERGLRLLAPWLVGLPGEDALAETQADIADLVPMRCYLHDSDKTASPMAPLDIIENALQAASVSRFTKKLLLGLPTFGIDYTRTANGYRKRMVDARQVCLSQNPPPEIRTDVENRAPYTLYKEEIHRSPIEHLLRFEDANSFAEKLALALRYGLCGVSICALDKNAPALWQVLNQTCKVIKCG